MIHRLSSASNFGFILIKGGFSFLSLKIKSFFVWSLAPSSVYMYDCIYDFSYITNNDYIIYKQHLDIYINKHAVK